MTMSSVFCLRCKTTEVNKNLIRYFDMFAGIGGFRAGLTRAGGFQCVGHCEIDKYADASYRAIHDIREEEVYYPDATKIDPGDLPDFDLLCAGFPCQPYSLSGKRKGFDDARGTLFFDIARLVEGRRPSYLLLENVLGLLSHDQGRTFCAILTALHELGYGLEWFVLNSADHGVPQSRRRVFIIGYLNPGCAGKVFPIAGNDGKALIQIIGGPQGSRVYDPAGVACTQTAGAGGMGGKTGLYFVGFNRKDGIVRERDTALTLNASDFRGINRNQTQNAVFVDLSVGNPEPTEAARCLTARYGQTTLSNHKAERSGVLLIKNGTKKGYKEAHPGDTVALDYMGSATRRGRVGHDIAHTLQANSVPGLVERGGRIRRLMPRECLRLQGFDEDQIDRLLAITSDAQAYKQAGNSVTVNVIEAIGRRIRAMDEELKAVDAA